MKPRLSFLLFLLPVSFLLSNEGELPTNKIPAPGIGETESALPLALYEKLIDYLRSCEDVLPAEPDYHPVAGMYNREGIGIDDDGMITVSKRMKEVRYMRKARAYSKSIYARQYQLESFEKEAGHLPGYQYLGHHGLDNGNGWAIHGFIENRKGRLRAYTYEENFSCMGCHNSVGSTIDKTYSFPRKIDGVNGWGYINLKGMPDVPSTGETRGEIVTYLARVGGGSEFRNNEEMAARWFRPDGSLDEEKVSRAKDVYELITPSRERALLLNKAYRTIVEDQDFIYGKDATVVPPANVYEHIDNTTAPTLPKDRIFDWNILLDWSSRRH